MKENSGNSFLSLSVFADIDRHFARLVERLAGGAQPELALAAALVSRACGEGHACLNLPDRAAIEQLLDGDAERLAELPPCHSWLEKLRASPAVGVPGEFKPLVLDAQGRLYLHRYWEYESNLAAAIRSRAEKIASGLDEARLADGLKRLFPESDGSEADLQKVAALVALRRNLCVISGGPGTGKTRTVALALALLLEQAGDRPLRIALAAPTGKAAARLQESVRQWRDKLPCDEQVRKQLPTEASTVHRLLGSAPGTAAARFNADNPLPVDVLVVDEASMVDLAMMAMLFAALPEPARIILVGDRDQLASVEAGAVLGDICGPSANQLLDTRAAGATPSPSPLPSHSGRGRTMGLPRVERQLFLLPTAAEESHRGAGELPLPEGEGWGEGEASAGFNPSSKEFSPLSTSGGLAECIVQLEKNYRFAAGSGILELSRAVNRGDADVAIKVLNGTPGLSAVSLPAPSGLKGALQSVVKEHFAALLAAAAGSGAAAGTAATLLAAMNRFRILTALRQGPFGAENVNRLVEEILSDSGLISTNGPWYPGRPVLVTENDYSLRLFNGDIGIILSEPASGQPIAFFREADGQLRAVSPARLPRHETVFAMTVHKSQGSEFERVLLVLPDRESPVVTRELVYTGITRASGSVEVWVKEPIFRAAVARRLERASGLREALWPQ